MRLRTFFFIGAILLVLLGVGAAAGLLWTTTLLRHQTEILTAAVGRVRAAADLRQSLVMLQVVRDFAEHQLAGVGPPLTEAQAQQQVQDALREVARYTTTGRQGELLAYARTHVDSFLRAHGHASLEELRRAVDASEAIVAASRSRAQELQEDARATTDAARVLGGGLGGAVLAGIVLVLFATHTRLYRPILSIRQALVAFKSGRRERRLEGDGVLELRELAAEFNDMAETLASQDARHVQFLAGVVHDLRSPLNVLKLSVQALLRPARQPAPEKVHESLTRILTQLGRLERMASDLMDQTRVEAGNLELRWEACDVRDLATEVVELHRPSSPQHGLELIVPDTPVVLRCDPTRLTQVLTNLVSNAIKYSPEGGGVRVVLELLPGEVVLSVSDEGVGVPADEHERIFEPFQRSKHPNQDIPGIGLGLSVSRRLVRAHGGDLEVTSQVGRGSTFRVRLPCKPA